MDNIEELKKARANTKRKVTVLIKKFKTSVHYGNEDSKTIYQNLDEEYYKLLDIQLQIEAQWAVIRYQTKNEKLTDRLTK